MRIFFCLIICLYSLSAVAQQDSTEADPLAELRRAAVLKQGVDIPYTDIFNSPHAINANTVELLKKGIFEFKVTHNFGDIAGGNGGIKTFYGMDNASDVRIGFQYGLTKNLNLIAARTRGAGIIQQQYEFGAKYRMLRQIDHDRHHPLSLTLFGNAVFSSMEASEAENEENSFRDFGDRTSQTLQLIIAKKTGRLSLQLNPTMVNRSYVPSYDQNTLFALGGAARLHLKGPFSLLFDYFHTFRGAESLAKFKNLGIGFHDAMGVGFEILTDKHVFNLNFTNATEILENRFISRTVTSWGKGQFRWGFTVAREFDFLYKKKHRKK